MTPDAIRRNHDVPARLRPDDLQIMNVLKEHFVHHRRYMLGCLAGALLSIAGGLVHEPVLTVSGAVICAGFCLQMIRMTAFKPNRS